jgi:uncharacterized protein YggT (Ycf19 family)
MSRAAQPVHKPFTNLAPRGAWLSLGVLLAISIINFIDRQAVSVLAPILRQALHLSNEWPSADSGRVA